MSRKRPDPSTGEGWRTVHVRPATYAWLSRLKGHGGSYDGVIREALTYRAVYFHHSTPGSDRSRKPAYFDRLAPTPEYGVAVAPLCEAADWIRRTRNGPLVCSCCGEPKYQTREELLL
jgi:hypothetical protein